MLKLAPEDIEPGGLAEVIGGRNRVKDFLAEDEQAVPRLRAAVEEDPIKRPHLLVNGWRSGYCSAQCLQRSTAFFQCASRASLSSAERAGSYLFRSFQLVLISARLPRSPMPKAAR